MSDAPSQADLRRATSTAYYALFHAIAHVAADAVVPEPQGDLSADAWRLAYRAVDHGLLRSACLNPNVLRRLPPHLANLAGLVSRLQPKRHLADYDPRDTMLAVEMADDIDDCEAAIGGFLAASDAERRCFVAFVLFRGR